jgi:hypothetical protein
VRDLCCNNLERWTSSGWIRAASVVPLLKLPTSASSKCFRPTTNETSLELVTQLIYIYYITIMSNYHVRKRGGQMFWSKFGRWNRPKVELKIA